jgi:hypothetical protein
MALELIICLLDDLKNAFGVVNEAMIQGVEKPLGIIFCILDNEKSVFYEVV